MAKQQEGAPFTGTAEFHGDVGLHRIIAKPYPHVSLIQLISRVECPCIPCMLLEYF